MYGPNDSYHPDHSHVIPGMMRRFHEAARTGDPSVMVWGTGSPRREFLYSDDFAEAALTVMENYDQPEFLNVGTGEDVTIKELAYTMAKVVGFKGEVLFDSSKPDGTPRKVLDVSKVKSLGWEPHISLEIGLRLAYEWALQADAFSTPAVAYAATSTNA
jgi:GDP-L-fucose synthase